MRPLGDKVYSCIQPLPPEELAGEMAVASHEHRSSGTSRFAFAFLPTLLVLVLLAIRWAVDDLWLYFIVGFPLAALGTWHALRRVRRYLAEQFPEAPPSSSLLLGGTRFWRDLGLVWLDGPALRFTGARSSFRIERREIHRVRFRAFARELDIYFTTAGNASRLRLGALVSLSELPRFHRNLVDWIARGEKLSRP